MKLSLATQLTLDEKEELARLKADFHQRKITELQYQTRISHIEEKAGLRAMEGDNAGMLLDLIDSMVKQSYPSLDEKKRSQFIYNNLLDLQAALMELNQNMTTKDTSKLDRVQKMKERFQ